MGFWIIRFLDIALDIQLRLRTSPKRVCLENLEALMVVF